MRSPIVLSLVLGLAATASSILATSARSAAFPVSTSPDDDYSVAAVTDGDGGALVAWFVQLGADESDVYVQRVGPIGASSGWPAGGLAVCTAPGEQFVTAMARDLAGGAFVAWTDGRAGGEDLDVYLHHVLASGVVDPAWPVDGLRLTAPSTEPKGGPRIAEDGAGGVYVAWHDYSSRPTGSDVFLQRVTAAGEVAPGWLPGGMLVCGAPEAQYLATVASGAAGAHVLWVDHRDGVEGDAYAQLVLPDGSFPPLWVVGGTPIGDGPAPQLEVEAIATPDGGVLAVWRDLRDEAGYGDLYGGRLLAAGGRAPGWPAAGKRLVSVPGFNGQARLVPDDSGGAFLAWTDGRAGEEFDADIYALRITGGGDPAPGWPANGFAVCTEPADQREPGIVGDGAGGIFVFWRDARAGAPGGYDLFAARMNREGALAAGWNAHGNALTCGAEVAFIGGVTGDASDGAYATWTRTNVGATDAYAVWVGAEPPPPPCTSGAGNPVLRLLAYPNPAAADVRLRVELDGAGTLEVDVFDLSGRRVRVVETGTPFNGGDEVAWDGRDDDGREAPPGVYLIHARAGAFSATNRVAWLGR